MATDEHYNEEGKVPEPLDDHQPTDMPATVGIILMIAFVAVISVMIVFAFQ